MKDPNTLENAVVELAGAVETCLGVDTMEDMRPSLSQIGTAVDELILGVKDTNDTRKVDDVPLVEGFEMMKHTVEVCLEATEVEPVKQTLSEMVRALRQIDRELAV
jgi:hypothetical protein